MSQSSAPLACADPTPIAGMVGIKRVDVSDLPPVLTVTLHLSDAIANHPALLDRRAYSLTGGSRLHPHIVRVDQAGADQVNLVLDSAGDFSLYTLSLAVPDADPFLFSHQLRFRLACAADYECRPAPPTPTPVPEESVAIDYLAKDYASFRQALLDFVPTRMPDWTERSEGDVGIALLELLAATGDNLSYVQDRVAAEAYLGTASQRRSIQGHLALVGYEMDEGASAHTWLHFQVATRHRLPGPDAAGRAGYKVATQPGALPGDAIFEAMESKVLFPEQNGMRLYDAGNSQCCLPHDSTSAVLEGAVGSLVAGDHVVFADTVRGTSDVVRLTRDAAPLPTLSDGKLRTSIAWSAVTPLSGDYCAADTTVLGNLVLATHGCTVIEKPPPLPGAATELPAQEAVVVPPSGPAGTLFQISVYGFPVDDRISVAVGMPGSPLGDPGGSFRQTELGGLEGFAHQSKYGDVAGVWQAEFLGAPSGRSVKAYWLVTSQQSAGMPAGGVRPRLRVGLKQEPLSWVDSDVLALAQPLPLLTSSAPAAGPPARFSRRSQPQVSLTVDGSLWRYEPSLLGSGPDDRVYRLETDDQGGTVLVFGRGGEGDLGQAAFGRRPPDGSQLELSYRIGVGSSGNVGAGTLTAPLDAADPSWFQSVTNPLPAVGGRDRETADHARRVGPAGIEKPLVAVTPSDYQGAADGFKDETGQNPVAQTMPSFSWTGSWLTAKLAVEARGANELNPSLAARLQDFLDSRRLAGYDLQLVPANYVPIQLQLQVCATPNAFAADVKRELEQALGNGTLPGGRRAFFNPDNFTFGQSLQLGNLFQAIMAVPGVLSARIISVAPLHAPNPGATTVSAVAAGELKIHPDQIIRLDNDPNFPEHGRLLLLVEGGR